MEIVLKREKVYKYFIHNYRLKNGINISEQPYFFILLGPLTQITHKVSK